jgi:hypothetical protein
LAEDLTQRMQRRREDGSNREAVKGATPDAKK